jgi:UDP-glucose 4-epimerase
MLRDYGACARAVALRYFNVAGVDPDRRSGQSMPRATHLMKVAAETALGERSHLEVVGTDYPTADGTCIRDYIIHVSDLVRAHLAALEYLRGGGDSQALNCGYGRGFSVLDVINPVKSMANLCRAHGPAPAGRCGRTGGFRRPDRRGARLEPAPRRPGYHRRPCARLGAASDGKPAG